MIPSWTLPTRRRLLATAGGLALLAAIAACSDRAGQPAPDRRPRPSILLVTLDTTRADAIGPEAAGVRTPAFDALAARGQRFRQAYATAPETLPSHASMMTGLYPAGHGVHENARPLLAEHATLAEQLRKGGYRTAAFVSSFVLARRFGLARGFETYDDELRDGGAERDSATTTDRAIAFLATPSQTPVFLWVHYFDPHAPYVPPDAFRGAYAAQPYLGEIAAMDAQLGRLVAAFERQAPGPLAVAVAGDHGEGLGDHGESQHGNLVYQSTMHVPLVLVGPGLTPGLSDTPVSTRRIFHTVLDWAGLGASDSLRSPSAEVVLGEAMKPYLEYGWQPQTMAVEGTKKAILAGTLETYDLAADPREERNLGAGAPMPSSLRRSLEEYPVPSLQASPAPAGLDDEARRRLASLGYIGASAPPVVRRDAPRPADMVHLFDLIEQASGLFVAERYAEAIPVLERIVGKDPHNLDAALRLATAHSSLGRDREALEAFRTAARIAPQSADVQMYLALHHARGADWERAVPVLERLAAGTPDRLPAVEALARIRERQGRVAEAIALYRQIHEQRAPSTAELIRLGQLAMKDGQTGSAIDAFERARTQAPPPFRHDLELGVLYLAARRLPEARAALDRVPASHPEHAMALFKRAQVSVLLNEPDRGARIEAARRGADATTRGLIASERLFQPAAPR
jgi:arylsulfatase A-like enzyme/tetratricopeptide (TPR) repeat protein